MRSRRRRFRLPRWPVNVRRRGVVLPDARTVAHPAALVAITRPAGYGQELGDEFPETIGPVGIGGVDEPIYAQLDGAAQRGQGAGNVGGGPQIPCR